MSFEVGRVLSERYRLIRPLGQGSQASVWVAEHLALSTQVAVKLIDPELAKKEDARERFRREATAAAQLRSAHVVQILDHGIDGEQPFIVMEMLEGEDLFERLRKRKRLSLQETSRVVTHVSRALTRAHAAGIVHRDLKPENFFIIANDDEEIIKVLDFGVAKVSDPKRVMQKTSVGTLVGTPHYMSPEQVKGIGEVDFRTDLWALGVIAYECITGELPFDSEGVGDLLIKISIGEVPVPSKVKAGLPAAFDTWFAKACDRDPAGRFVSARDLAEALARVAGLTAEAPSVTDATAAASAEPATVAAPTAPAAPRPSASLPRPSSVVGTRPSAPPPSGRVKPLSAPSIPAAPRLSSIPDTAASSGQPSRPPRPASASDDLSSASTPLPSKPPPPPPRKSSPEATRSVAPSAPSAPPPPATRGARRTVELDASDIEEVLKDPKAPLPVAPVAPVAPTAPTAEADDLLELEPELPPAPAPPAPPPPQASAEPPPAPPASPAHISAPPPAPPPAPAVSPSTPPRAPFESQEISFEEPPPPARPNARPISPVLQGDLPPHPNPPASNPPPAPPAPRVVSQPPPQAAPHAQPVDAPHMQSTVSGMAAISPPPELDGGGRRRRMVRVFAFALIALTGVVVWAVISSQPPPETPIPPPERTGQPAQALDTPPDPTPAPTPEIPATSTTTTTSTASPGATVEAVDPMKTNVAPLPSQTATPTPVPGKPRPRKPAKTDDMTIEIPLPPGDDLPPPAP